MRLLLISLVVLHQVATRCDREKIEEELERDRKADSFLHGCRSCKEVSVSLDACPELGYECDVNLSMATTVLSPSDCSCTTARCADRKAKMFADGKFADKLRCRDGKWTVGDGEILIDGAVCGLSCGPNVCNSAHANASTDFYPLTVNHPESDNYCAFVDYCEYGFAALNADGTLDEDLGRVLTATCSSDGMWEAEGQKYEYIMCKSPDCGPDVCPKQNDNVKDSNLVPLVVTRERGQCAVARCPGGLVKLDVDGTAIGELPGMDELTCQTDHKWRGSGDNEFESVMCKQPPCPNVCEEKPVVLDPRVGLATAPKKNGCTYTCAPGESLIFLGRSEDRYPIGTPSATCNSGGLYSINTTFQTGRIGCMPCNIPDGEVDDPRPGRPAKAKSTNCVAKCPDGYQISFFGGPPAGGNYLVRFFYGVATGVWWDPVHGVPSSSSLLECNKS